MNSGDASLLHNLFDLPSFAALLEQKSEAAKIPGFMEGFLGKFNFMVFGTQTLQNIRNGSFHLLHNIETKGQRHLVFRVFGTGGLNYYDFTLVKIKDSVKASDVLPFITGELLSTNVATVVDLAVDGAKTTGQLSEEMAALVQMRNYKLKADFTSVKTSFEKLEPRYQRNRVFQIYYIEACQHLDKALYKQALENYHDLWPEAPNAFLLMLDMYYMNQDFEKLLTTINQLDSLVGGDPFLDLFRGNAVKSLGKTAEAEQYYLAVEKYDPASISILQLLLLLYSETHQPAKAKATLERYRATAGARKDIIDDLVKKYPELRTGA